MFERFKDLPKGSPNSALEMASMRDAMKRLAVINDNCNPEAAESSAAEKGLDEFTRLKKKIHADALKDREILIQQYGTTTATAQAAYQVRVLLRNLKEDILKLKDVLTKLEKKKGKKRLPDEELAARREITNLCGLHVDELDNLEKRRFNEKIGVDRAELLATTGDTGTAAFTGPRRNYGETQESPERNTLFDGNTVGKKKGKKGKKGDVTEPLVDPFVSELPDIDNDPGVAEDFKKMNDKNLEIDNELDEIGKGVKKLKDIAINMDEELDVQAVALDKLEVDIDKALDEIDNVNIKMKKMLDQVMKGDKFMVNCILICLVLSLIGFISSFFFP